MFKNYFKTAIRNLWKNKVFSIINIFGLAVGLASCLIIILYILEESSYDKHQKYGDSIFRIASQSNKEKVPWVAEPAPLAFTVKNNLPEVDQVTRLMTFSDIAKMLVKYQGGSEQKQFFETNGYYVDSTFFQIFSYDFVYGNGESALADPNSLAISKTMSAKYFGISNPVGKSLLINTPFGEFNYTVKAVFDDSKYKSHIPANYFLSMRNNDMWNWVQRQTALMGNSLFYTYVKMKPGIDAKLFEQKLQSYYDKLTGREAKAAGISIRLFLQPLKDIYLHSSGGNEIAVNGNITYLYILGCIAAFMLIIACINFMNLNTARSEKRAREVGVRKAVGASRSLLIGQFLGESFMMCIISLVIALALVQLLLPFFNDLIQKNIHFFDSPSLLFWIAVLTLTTGLFTGLYPAFYLSSFRPVSILKGKIVKHLSATLFRKGLVIFQFAISICLVFAAIAIWKQMDYLKSWQLGFNKEQKFILPLQEGYLNSEKNYTALKNELLKFPEIKSVTSASSYPGIINFSDMLFYSEGKTRADNVDVRLTAVNNDFIETLGLQLLSGRAFSNAFNDSAGIILNETAIKQLGYTAANAVGKKIRYDVNDFHGTMNITGVVKDFNFESLHNMIQPCGFTTVAFGNRYGYLIANLNTKDYAGIINKVQRSWAKLDPGVPFNYSFLDQDFQRNYEKEQRTSSIVTYLSILTILIACLGLFGLSAFSAEQRIKEIGIRKVLGASVTGITLMLSKEFTKLVLIAFVTASPVAWWAINKWLQSFAYRIDISWWIFLAAGGSAMLIALITVSFQSIKAAMANPVKSLRTE